MTIQPTRQPVPVYALHERLPHRPRPSVVRRFLSVLPAPLMGLGFTLALAALLSFGPATRADLPWLALLLVLGCLLFAAGVRAAPGEVGEYVETGNVEWYE